MKTFKTPKGTELNILNLRGKDYLEVNQRLVWFRESHPDWSIETEPRELNEVFAILKATIKNEQGRIMAQAHKREDQKHFPDYMEKAETSAIGRALALCGFGTQFAPDLAEENRIVDAPIARHKYSTPELQSTVDDFKSTVARSQIKVVDQVKEAFPGAVVKHETNLGDYVPTFGKYKGQALSNFEVKELLGYCDYIERKAKEDKKPLQGQVAEFIRAVQGYAQESKYEV